MIDMPSGRYGDVSSDSIIAETLPSDPEFDSELNPEIFKIDIDNLTKEDLVLLLAEISAMYDSYNTARRKKSEELNELTQKIKKARSEGHDPDIIKTYHDQSHSIAVELGRLGPTTHKLDNFKEKLKSKLKHLIEQEALKAES